MERDDSQKRKTILRIKEHTQNLQFILNDASFFICFTAASTQRAKIDRLFLSPLILAVPLTMTLGLECTNRTINQKEQRTFKAIWQRGEGKYAEKFPLYVSLIIDKKKILSLLSSVIYFSRQIYLFMVSLSNLKQHRVLFHISSLMLYSSQCI